jgi:hypothetical protein
MKIKENIEELPDSKQNTIIRRATEVDPDVFIAEMLKTIQANR